MFLQQFLLDLLGVSWFGESLDVVQEQESVVQHGRVQIQHEFGVRAIDFERCLGFILDELHVRLNGFNAGF